MTQQFYHGSQAKIDSPLRRGTCVSHVRYNAALFARRRSPKGGFLYVLTLDAAEDLSVEEDSAGVRDYVLARDIPYTECLAVTDDFLAACKAQIPDLS
jgi:hypothetical protein